MILYFLLAFVALALICAPLIPVFSRSITGSKARRNVRFNLCGFAGVMLLMIAIPVGGFVSAAPESGGAETLLGIGEGMKYLAAALSTGLASLGAGIAVGNAAPAAIGACSEDPKAFGRAMIFVVMGEGIAIYGLIISFLILFL